MQLANTEIGLDQYWRIIKRRWLPLLAIFGTTVAAFNYWGSIQTPIYEAEGKLRIKSNDTTSALTGLDDERGQLRSLNKEESPIETEAELMTMTPLVREVIERMNYRNGEGDLISVGEFLGNLDIDTENDTDILNVQYQSADIDLAKAVVNTLMDVYLAQNLLDNRAEAVAAREFIENQLPDAESRALSAGAALRNFKERNQIIELGRETEATVSTINDITAQITNTASQLYETEAQYRLVGDRIGQDPQTAMLAVAVSQSSGVQQILREYQEVETLLANESVRFQDQHPNIVDLQTRLANLDRVLDSRIQAVIGAQSLPASANFQSGELEIGMVNEYLRLESRLIGLRENLSSLLAAEEAYASRGSLLPQLEQEQRELQRQLDAAQSTYSSLLQRLQEVRVFENKNVGNARIVQPAEALRGKVAPDEDKYLATGVMLGIVLAIAAVVLLESINQTIKTVTEARESFKRPVLGVIPNFKDLYKRPRKHLRLPVLGVIPGLSIPDWRLPALREPIRVMGDREVPTLITDSSNISLASESFHILRNNLKFLSSDNPPKVIAITSTGPSEGKSTVASNLAASIAKTGQRVLLIDADLHRPIQHWIWDVASRHGLSDFLAGQATLLDVFVPLRENLTGLLAGSLPPDPVSLLDSQKMLDLLDDFRQRFDYVILDAPSLRSVATASILGKMVDGLLLVVRPGVADRTSVNYAKELIGQSKQNVLGIVVNGTLARYEPYSYFLSDEFYGAATGDVSYREDETLEEVVSGARR